MLFDATKQQRERKAGEISLLPLKGKADEENVGHVDALVGRAHQRMLRRHGTTAAFPVCQRLRHNEVREGAVLEQDPGDAFVFLNPLRRRRAAPAAAALMSAY